MLTDYMQITIIAINSFIIFNSFSIYKIINYENNSNRCYNKLSILVHIFPKFSMAFFSAHANHATKIILTFLVTLFFDSKTHAVRIPFKKLLNIFYFNESKVDKTKVEIWL